MNAARLAVGASVAGPFVFGLPIPIVVATGFRATITLHVCQGGNLARGALVELGEDLASCLSGPGA